MKSKEIRSIAFAGIILCFLAVIIGAFGAHALSGLLELNQRVDVFELANRYQFYHGIAMIALAALFKDNHGDAGLAPLGLLMFFGTLVFSGSLYLLALLDVGWLGAVTPIGGVILLFAWALLSIKVLRFIS